MEPLEPLSLPSDSYAPPLLIPQKTREISPNPSASSVDPSCPPLDLPIDGALGSSVGVVAVRRPPPPSAMGVEVREGVTPTADADVVRWGGATAPPTPLERPPAPPGWPPSRRWVERWTKGQPSPHPPPPPAPPRRPPSPRPPPRRLILHLLRQPPLQRLR